MNKATHSGTCQWCGHWQKLPSGKLAKHGYTVKWGFFSGTCQGSDALPYEQSCDLVKWSIAEVRKQRAALVDLCAKLRASTSTTLEVEWYKPATQGYRRDYGHRWITVTIAMEKGKYDTISFTYTDPNGKKQSVIEFYEGVKTMEAAVAHLNEKRAKAYERTMRDMDKYIAYQTERVANWKPAPLKEVKA